MSASVITWREFECDGDTYLITVRNYGEDHVTAQWLGRSRKGELSFGVGNCDEAIDLAEREIVKASDAQSERRH